MKCDRCGQDLEIGDFPFCPHGRGHAASHGDEIDYIDHNLGPEPIHITSHAQRRALMAASGRTEFIRHTPVPGTDRSPYTSDWSKGSVDAKTLANAEEIVARHYGPKPEPEPDETYEPVANAFTLTATPEMVRELSAGIAGVAVPQTETEVAAFWKDFECQD